MKPHVSTTEYQFAHGHMPRGRGNWLFRIGGGPHSFGCIPYATAKRYAIAFAKANGLLAIKVCS